MKTNYHVKKIILFSLSLYFFFSLCGIAFNNPSDSSSITPLEIKASSIHNLGSYSEAQFITIYINTSDITMDEIPYSLTTENRVKCSFNITYPTTNNTWKFILPSIYYDATNYYIKRSSTDFNYCLEDENASARIRYTGEDSYWIIDGNPSITDIINFEILTPLVDLDELEDESTLNKTTFELNIYRTDLTRHSYNNLHFTHNFNVFYENYEIQVFNYTGGINENITDTVEITSSITLKNGGYFIFFDINLGYIQKATDYKFKIFFLKVAVPPSFSTDFFANIILPLMTGFIVGLLASPYVVKIFKIEINTKKTKDLFKKGSPVGIVFALLFLGANYLIYTFKIFG
jgi:hypothetical protein